MTKAHAGRPRVLAPTSYEDSYPCHIILNRPHHVLPDGCTGVQVSYKVLVPGHRTLETSDWRKPQQVVPASGDSRHTRSRSGQDNPSSNLLHLHMPVLLYACPVLQCQCSNAAALGVAVIGCSLHCSGLVRSFDYRS